MNFETKNDNENLLRGLKLIAKVFRSLIRVEKKMKEF